MKRCTLTFTPDTLQTATATTTTTSTAAELIAGNVDLLLLVLLRMPLKPIVKFEAVSKHWRSILRGPYFSHRRFPDTSAPSGLLVHEVPLNYGAAVAIESRVSFVPIIDQEEQQRPPYDTTPPPPVSSLTFVSPDPDYRISIINSCNGLLICCDDSKSRKDYLDRYPPRRYFVLNPTTKRFRIILNCREDDETNNYKPKKILGMVLAYDPVCLLNYKVVCVVESDVRLPPNIKVTSTPFRIMIYSSDTRAWRYSGDPFCYPGVDFRNNGVFLNGAVYWVSHHGSSLYFHLDTESLKILAMPKDHKSSTIWYFGKHGNMLQLIYLERGRGILDGYEMEAAHSISDYSYSAGWLFKFQISSAGISKYTHFDIHSMFWEEDDPLLVVEEDQEVLQKKKKKKKPFLVIRTNRTIIRLNVMDNTSEKIFDIPKISEATVERHEVFPYFESLACV